MSNTLKFLVHNHSLAPSYSVPALDAYRTQKNIHVVSNVEHLCLEGSDCHLESTHAGDTMASFFEMRIKMALGQETSAQPSYFPGGVIPGPGGATCSEVERGNLLFDQFRYLLAFDGELATRISEYSNIAQSKNGQSEVSQTESALGNTLRSNPLRSYPPPSRLFCSEPDNSEKWLWHYVEQPSLYFLHQAPQPEMDRPSAESALEVFTAAALRLYKNASVQYFEGTAVNDLLSLISDAWFNPSSGVAPITWGLPALTQAKAALRKFAGAVDADNLLPFLFEVEAMASFTSLTEEREDRTSFARGVFAGNFVDVAMAPITSIKPTEFCVRERLFDEVINLSSRGFAPVVINEYGMVADGNHRLTAAYVWNLLKYCQDLEWSLDNEEFQQRVARFAEAVENGLLKTNHPLPPVSLHQVLNHLAYFLCRPDWRSRLNSYTRPLLKRHDFISELPVVVLPEYLCGAVVKSCYDDGEKVERACPSMYETMSLNNHLVLPPRASYHFTDAALLPWFTVLKTSCGSKRRPHNHSLNTDGRKGRITKL